MRIVMNIETQKIFEFLKDNLEVKIITNGIGELYDIEVSLTNPNTEEKVFLNKTEELI